MLTLTAILFAGGESRRMGSDKATLEIAGEQLWHRQLRVLRQLQPQTVWISARTRPAWCPADVRAVLDEAPFCGPLSGLATTLGHLQTTHLLAFAVDLPFMAAAHLGKVWGLARDHCGVVPFNGNFFEPLCAIYPREASAVAKAQFDSGEASLQGLVRKLEERRLIRAYRVPDSEAGFYHNMNTPSEVPVRST